MKLAKFSKKLRFTKETVAHLNCKEMNAAQAGVDDNVGNTPGCTVSACQTQCPSIWIGCKYC